VKRYTKIKVYREIDQILDLISQVKNGNEIFKQIDEYKEDAFVLMNTEIGYISLLKASAEDDPGLMAFQSDDLEEFIEFNTDLMNKYGISFNENDYEITNLDEDNG